VYGSGGAPRGRQSTYLFKLSQTTMLAKFGVQGIQLAAIFKRSDFPEIQ
jgi:hypothetical protein